MTTSIHLTALDSVVNVNSLLTLAVFIGLTWNPYDSSNTLVDPASRCFPNSKIAEDLIKFHVYSFSSFLFSSLTVSLNCIEEMEAPKKFICILAFLAIMGIAGFNGVDGHGDYGPCGKHNIEKEAEKLAPCTEAAKYWQAPVSDRCCDVIEKKLKNPGCLCAILFSRTAYNAGVKPEVAVTIPKRCNIPVRPVGHKCGAFPFV